MGTPIVVIICVTASHCISPPMLHTRSYCYLHLQTMELPSLRPTTALSATFALQRPTYRINVISCRHLRRRSSIVNSALSFHWCTEGGIVNISGTPPVPHTQTDILVFSSENTTVLHILVNYFQDVCGVNDVMLPRVSKLIGHSESIVNICTCVRNSRICLRLVSRYNMLINCYS